MFTDKQPHKKDCGSHNAGKHFLLFFCHHNLLLIQKTSKARFLYHYINILQSGSTLAQAFTTSCIISSNLSSSASMVIFCARKLTLASLTPPIFLMASSIFAAQLAQSRSSSLNFFFISLHPFLSFIICIPALFVDMLSALGYDRPHMGVCQRIEYRLAFPSALHQPGLFQDFKLMRDGRLGHVQYLCQIAHTHLGFEQHVQNTDPGGIPENLKQLRQVIERIFLRHPGIHKR